jgi:hypothetical protein
MPSAFASPANEGASASVSKQAMVAIQRVMVFFPLWTEAEVARDSCGDRLFDGMIFTLIRNFRAQLSRTPTRMADINWRDRAIRAALPQAVNAALLAVAPIRQAGDCKCAKADVGSGAKHALPRLSRGCRT